MTTHLDIPLLLGMFRLLLLKRSPLRHSSASPGIRSSVALISSMKKNVSTSRVQDGKELGDHPAGALVGTCGGKLSKHFD